MGGGEGIGGCEGRNNAHEACTLWNCHHCHCLNIAGKESGIAITDFGIAMLESDLASEQADRQSLVGKASPSGGFHKRHLVTSTMTLLNGMTCTWNAGPFAKAQKIAYPSVNLTVLCQWEFSSYQIRGRPSSSAYLLFLADLTCCQEHLHYIMTLAKPSLQGVSDSDVNHLEAWLVGCQVGTLEYLAPEVLLKQPYSFPADVYAWGVTVNEIATRVVPFSDCTKDNPAAHTVLNFGYGRSISKEDSPLLNTNLLLHTYALRGWHLLT